MTDWFNTAVAGESDWGQQQDREVTKRNHASPSYSPFRPSLYPSGKSSESGKYLTREKLCKAKA